MLNRDDVSTSTHPPDRSPDPRAMLENAANALRFAKAAVQKENWVLIAPDGRVWASSDAAQIMRAMVFEMPLPGTQAPAHLDICSSRDDTMARYPACDCGAA